MRVVASLMEILLWNQVFEFLALTKHRPWPCQDGSWCSSYAWIFGLRVAF